MMMGAAAAHKSPRISMMLICSRDFLEPSGASGSDAVAIDVKIVLY